MNTLGFISSWQFNQDPAQNPALVNMAFPPGMTQSTVQPVGPYYWNSGGPGGLAGLRGLRGSIMPPKIYGVLSVLSGIAMAYHGIKRNHGSIGWGAWWALMGGLFPIFAPIVAVAQTPGFAKAK